ncbi:DNA-binding domain-containing protein [uncultured Tolumonas sp.]|uniref:DNA-binding domain-containing protein n=1 Tax=uncultured Tolumonas sp. TaxID=263765 RepID=UPI002A0A9BCF|nr:DNA-binding domain-containing protein [uncultured Tolumonas sp.]
MQLADWQYRLQHQILAITDLPQILSGTAIYQQAYQLRLAEALQYNYPALYQLLGDEEFFLLSGRYRQQYPSSHPSIRWFGAQLSEFLRDHNPYSAIPLFGELAQFEWALRHTIDAADTHSLTSTELQNIHPQAWGKLQIKTHPALSMFHFNWNTTQVWQALEFEHEPPQPESADSHWIIWRKHDFTTVWRSCLEMESFALMALQSGMELAELCCVLEEHSPPEEAHELPLQVANWLFGWLEQNIVSCILHN